MISHEVAFEEAGVRNGAELLPATQGGGDHVRAQDRRARGGTIMTKTETDPLLDAGQVIEWLAGQGLKLDRSTWRSYVRYGRAPKPDRPDLDTVPNRRTPKWRQSTVAAYLEHKRARGGVHWKSVGADVPPLGPGVETPAQRPLGPFQADVLLSVPPTQPCTFAELRQRVDSSPQQLSETLAVLGERGLVTIERAGRRTRTVVLSDAGRTKLGELEALERAAAQAREG